MAVIKHSYGVHRCGACGVQRSEGPECGACGAPNSKREWIEVVPADLHRGAVKEVETLRAGISWARGMLTDGERPDKIDVFLGSLLDYPGGQ